VASVFAGFDVDATNQARAYFAGYMPSSPSIGLLRNGQLVYMLQRHQIENQNAPDIAAALTAAFDKFCAVPATIEERGRAGFAGRTGPRSRSALFFA
jgi:hypothetical protein